METPPRNGERVIGRLVHVDLFNSDVVLDIACGSGLWIIEAAKEWKVDATDNLFILSSLESNPFAALLCYRTPLSQGLITSRPCSQSRKCCLRTFVDVWNGYTVACELDDT